MQYKTVIKAQIFFLFVSANYFLSKRTVADIYNQFPVSENVSCHFLGITWLLADVKIVINREPGIGSENVTRTFRTNRNFIYAPGAGKKTRYNLKEKLQMHFKT